MLKEVVKFLVVNRISTLELSLKKSKAAAEANGLRSRPWTVWAKGPIRQLSR